MTLIFNCIKQVANFVDCFQVRRQLREVKLWSVAFAGVLPWEQVQVVRASPMVPGWVSLSGFSTFCALLCPRVILGSRFL